MVEETVEDIEEFLDLFLCIWGNLPLTSLLMTGLVPVEWSISVLLKAFTEGKKVHWLLDWIVVLKEVVKLNLFAISPIGATIQDGGKRKRKQWSHASLLSRKIKRKRNIKSRKIDKRKRKMLVSKHTITPCSLRKDCNSDVTYSPPLSVYNLFAEWEVVFDHIWKMDLITSATSDFCTEK